MEVLHGNSNVLPEQTSKVIIQSLKVIDNFPTDSHNKDHIYETDNDETFLKTVHLVPQQSHVDTEDNLYCPIDTHNQSYPESSLDPDGNVYCAQKDSNPAYYACPGTQYRLDTVIHDRLDSGLHDLPKELYISTALEISDKCEETLSFYRNELVTRARQSENPPNGIIKDRRKSNKFSIAEKYAQDCYLINQFIEGNLTDIDDLFKKTTPAQFNQSLSQRNHAPSTPKHSKDLDHDIKLMKNNFANLQSEVHMLKLDAAETKSKLSSISKDLKLDIDILKEEVIACSEALTETLNHSPQYENSKLSNRLKSMAQLVNKLDNSRTHAHAVISDLNQRVSDNSINITNLQDSETQKKNSVKMQMQQVNEKIEKAVQNVSEKSKSTESDALFKSLDGKIKNVEKKLTQNDTSSCFNKAFSSFSEEISCQLKSLNKNLISSIEKLVNNNSGNDVKSADRIESQETSVIKSADRIVNQVNSVITDSNKNKTLNRDKHITRLNVPTTNPYTSKATQPEVQTRPEVQSQPEVQHRHEIVDLTQPPPCDLSSANSDNEHTFELSVPFRPKHGFRGVIRKKAKSYIITGIDLESDQEGLEDFLNDIGVQFKSAKFLYTRRPDCQAAQIVINEDQSNLVENPDTWPAGISCRPWMQRTDYRSRFSNNDS